MSTPNRTVAALLFGLVLPADPNAQGSGHPPVCAGADRVWYHTADEPWSPGRTLYRLALARADRPAEPGEEPQTGEALADLSRRVETLTQRVVALERTSGPSPGIGTDRGKPGTGSGSPPSRVTAPFEVVDKTGRPIFKVTATPRAFFLHMASGEVVVTGSALPGGGFVKALAVNQGLQTVMGVNGGFAGFVARENETARATLSIHDQGKASVEIANDNGTVVATLLHGASGGGQLQLGDATGAAMVEAGVTSDGLGLVRAYPLGHPGVGLVGAPGTFILGKR